MPFDSASFGQSQTTNIGERLKRALFGFRRAPVQEPETVILLRRGKALIRTKDQWLQGTISNPERTRFCAIGALTYAANQLSVPDRTLDFCTRELNAASHRYGYPSIIGLNDRSSHRKVLRAYDRAINRLLYISGRG